MTRCLILPLLFLLVPVAAADDRKPAPKDDAEAIKGKWQMTASTFDGKAHADEVVKKRTLVFTDKEFTAFEGEKKGNTVKFSLDPKADPKRIDLTRSATGKQAPGIYSLSGDELKLCYAEPGAERPEKFASEAGSKVFLIVLKRVKD